MWPVLAAMIAWGDRLLRTAQRVTGALLHDQCGGLLATELTCTACATAVSSEEVTTVDGPGATT